MEQSGGDGFFATSWKGIKRSIQSVMAMAPENEQPGGQSTQETKANEAEAPASPEQSETTSVVNDGGSGPQVSPRAVEPPTAKTTSPEEARTSEQNDKRLSNTTPNPIERYRSPSNSFPDYGQLSRKNYTMGSFLKMLNRRNGPRDTLHGKSPVQQVDKRKSSMPQNLDSHPPKRAKTDQTTTVYTEARLLPQDMAGSFTETSASRHGAGSQKSARSTVEEHVHSGVSEYRAAESRVQPGSRNRRTRGRHGLGPRGSVEDFDPITDPEGMISSPRERPAGHAKHAWTLDGSNSNPGQVTKQLNKNAIYDTDELSNSFGSACQIDPSATAPREGSSAQSASLSTRGNIKQSVFTKKSGENPVYSEGVSLDAANWQPNCMYVHDGAKGPCRLRSQTGNRTAGRDILELVGEGGQQVHGDWFLLESEKLKGIVFNKEDSVMKLTMPSSPARGTGALLFLQFPDSTAAGHFLAWLDDNASVKRTADPAGRIGKEFQRSYQGLTRRPFRPVPPRPASLPPHDLGLLQQRQEHRQNQQNEAHRKPRMIDGLASDFASSYTQQQGQDGPRRSTRQTLLQRHSTPPEPEPQHWTEKNPEWDKNWRLPLVYQRTLVEKDDIPRLDEGQCLNDNLIGFYLRYLYTELQKHHPETARRVYFHNSFFYEKLKPSRGKINYQGVKNWTSKVDLLSYDYIVVPVNEHYHWWVAIICNPDKLDPDARKDDAPGNQSAGEEDIAEPEAARVDGESVEVKSVAEELQAQLAGSPHPEEAPLVVSDIVPEGGDQEVSSKVGPPSGTDNVDKDTVVELDAAEASAPGEVAANQEKLTKSGKLLGRLVQKFDPADPRIITLDSLGSAHSPVCQHLKQYLIAEFKDKKDKDVEYTKPIGLRAMNLPEQRNFTDCGVYLLEYVSKFLEDPDSFVRGILQKTQSGWNIDPSKSRNEMRELIFKLHDEYQRQQEATMRAKQLAKGKRSARSSVALRSSVERSTEPVSSRPDSNHKAEVAVPHEVILPGTLVEPEPRPLISRPEQEAPGIEITGPSEPRFVHIELPEPQVANKQEVLGDIASPIPIPDTPPKGPIQSIEVPNDDEIEVARTPPRPRLRHVSPGLPIDITDDKEVLFVTEFLPAKKRIRSESVVEAESKRARSRLKLPSPDLGSSPPRPRPAALVSPFFTPGAYAAGQMAHTHAAAQRAPLTKTYGGPQAKKARTQEPTSTSKVRTSGRPKHIDLTED